mmetsp:Transcript_5711/g.11328  ORF Transcript_5711/g.11328 Transcript_5711/m.11328 type:complete len:223 (-) Transcript_5711:430-1098(-)
MASVRRTPAARSRNNKAGVHRGGAPVLTQVRCSHAHHHHIIIIIAVFLFFALPIHKLVAACPSGAILERKPVRESLLRYHVLTLQEDLSSVFSDQVQSEPRDLEEAWAPHRRGKGIAKRAVGRRPWGSSVQRPRHLFVLNREVIQGRGILQVNPRKPLLAVAKGPSYAHAERKLHLGIRAPTPSHDDSHAHRNGADPSVGRGLGSVFDHVTQLRPPPVRLAA